MSIINPHRFVAGFSFNNALLFDGTNDNCSFTQLGSTNSTWAYSGWINSSTVNTTNQGLITDSNSNNYVRLQNSNSRVIVRMNGTNYFFTGFSFSNNTDYHVVVSVNAGSCRVWIDDVESSAGAIAIITPASAIDNFNEIGRDNGGNNLAGKYDEWALWYGSFLTDANVTTLFGGGSGSDVSAINPGTLYVGSHMDETSGIVSTANLGSSGTISLNNFTGNPWVPH